MLELNRVLKVLGNIMIEYPVYEPHNSVSNSLAFSCSCINFATRTPRRFSLTVPRKIMHLSFEELIVLFNCFSEDLFEKTWAINDVFKLRNLQQNATLKQKKTSRIILTI